MRSRLWSVEPSSFGRRCNCFRGRYCEHYYGTNYNAIKEKRGNDNK
nr:MAG TPA: hypothetical protein [Caudoviricetes sp.]